MPAMDVELLLVPECPHQAAAEVLLQSALRDVGLTQVSITTTVISAEDEAERRGFTGSPTVLIDGADPFAQAEQPASIACRIYQSPGGPSGIPDLRLLRQALKRAAHANLLATVSL